MPQETADIEYHELTFKNLNYICLKAYTYSKTYYPYRAWYFTSPIHGFPIRREVHKTICEIVQKYPVFL